MEATKMYKKLFRRIHYRKSVIVILLVAICLTISAFLHWHKTPQHLVFEDLFQEDEICLFGVTQNTSKSEFESMIGVSYSEYLTKLDQAMIQKDVDLYLFYLENLPVICTVRIQDDVVHDLIFHFIEDTSISDQEWIEQTNTLIDKLSFSSTDSIYHTYTLPQAQIQLELSGIFHNGIFLGNKATEMWVTFSHK